MKILIVNGLEWEPEYPFTNSSNDVGAWFMDAFGGNSNRFAIWRVQLEESPPPIPYQGVIIGGSLSSVYDTDPWIRRLEDTTKRWIDKEIPLLGVCFGHQLIAQALGGKVIRNPSGWEIGTHLLQRHPTAHNDPLFRGLPDSFPVMEAHQDAVIELPPGAECLAKTSHCAIQSFRVGTSIRAIQFHPEFTPHHIQILFQPYIDFFREQGIDCRKIFEDLRPTPESRQIFANFEQNFIQANCETLL